MPRDGSGVYTKPYPSVVSGTTIESLVYNGTVDDIALQLNGPIPVSSGGTGSNTQIGSANNTGTVSVKGAQTWTDAEKTQGRSNIYAAPLDALAYNGMQVNGSMDVSQEKGVTSTSVSNGGDSYIVDGWKIYTLGGQVVVGAPAPGTAPGGLRQSVQLRATTANAAPATGAMAVFYQYIEGYRITRLAWGTGGGAQPITIGFWAYATVTGLFSGSVQNGATNRSYVFTYNINAINTWEYKTVTIPGDQAGTWVTDNTAGMALNFTLLAGSSFITTGGVWTAGNFCGVTGTTNLLKNTTDFLLLTGVVVIPGNEAPSAARSPLIMRPYDQELILCKRYYQKIVNPPGLGLGNGTSVLYYWSFPFPVAMRTTPSALLSGNVVFSGASAQYTAGSTNANYCTTEVWHVNLSMTATVPGGFVTAIVNATAAIADARL